MKIELKGIKIYERMSEETVCFHASLWVDGKRLCTVSNRGIGGENDYSANYREVERVDAWCKANLPRWGGSEDPSVPVDSDGYETNLEVHIEDLLNRFLRINDLKKHLKRGVVLLPKNGTLGVGEFGVIKHPNYSNGSKVPIDELGHWLAKVERDNPSDLVISQYNDDARDVWLRFCEAS